MPGILNHDRHTGLVRERQRRLDIFRGGYVDLEVRG